MSEKLVNLCEKYVKNNQQLERITNLLKYDYNNQELWKSIEFYTYNKANIETDIFKIMYEDFGKDLLKKVERFDNLYGGY